MCPLSAIKILPGEQSPAEKRLVNGDMKIKGYLAAVEVEDDNRK